MRRRFLIRTAAVDVALVIIATFAASLILFGAPPWQTAPNRGSLLPIGLYFVIGAFLGTLLATSMWSKAPSRPTYGRGFLIAMLGTLSVAVLIVLLRPYFSRPHLALTAGIWLILLMAYRWVNRRRPWTDRLFVISDQAALIEHLRAAPHVELFGVYEPSFDGELEPLDSGTIVVVDLSAVLSDRMARFVSSSSIAGRVVRPFNEVYEEHTGRIPLVHLSEGWEIEATLSRTLPLLPFKHFLDSVLVIVFAVLWVPIVAITALVVLIGDGRPVFYHQQRTGQGGKPITLVKFRSMHPDAEADGDQQAGEDDPRITRVGRRLRRMRLDELPQLWNVLRGDLSIVGPRPEQLSFVAQYTESIPFYEQRHLVRPGITGWAQVNAGYAASHQETLEKLSYDFYYLKRMSPLLDLEIMARSIWTILTGDKSR